MERVPPTLGIAEGITTARINLGRVLSLVLLWVTRHTTEENLFESTVHGRNPYVVYLYAHDME